MELLKVASMVPGLTGSDMMSLEHTVMMATAYGNDDGSAPVQSDAFDPTDYGDDDGSEQPKKRRCTEPAARSQLTVTEPAPAGTQLSESELDALIE